MPFILFNLLGHAFKWGYTCLSSMIHLSQFPPHLLMNDNHQRCNQTSFKRKKNREKYANK